MSTSGDTTVSQKMNKKARVDAALRGEAVDRPPVSLWRHFFECEQTSEDLAGAMLAFHKKHDWDWMKINPRASYHVEDWGVVMDYKNAGPLGKPRVVQYAIQSPSDWAKLKPLPTTTGALDEQLEVVERIGESLGGETYYIQTVFSPLAIAGYLVENPRQAILDLMQRDPHALHGALEVITETYAEYVNCCLDEGACGIFFATTDWASRDVLTQEQYAEWGRPYDLRVLARAQRAPFNVLHVCKNNNMLYSLADYPVHALSWAVGSPGNPGLGDVQLNCDKAVIGGWKNETLRDGTPDMIKAEAQAAREQTGGRGLMLGPACSIAVDTPEENVKAARAAADALLAV